MNSAPTKFNTISAKAAQLQELRLARRLLDGSVEPKVQLHIQAVLPFENIEVPQPIVHVAWLEVELILVTVKSRIEELEAWFHSRNIDTSELPSTEENT